MKTYYQVTCELYTEHVVPVLNAKQYDSGRGVDITLTDCGAVVVPAGGDVCNLYCKKTDGTVSYLSGTITGDAVRVDFTNTLLAVPGVIECELEVTSGSDTVSTPVFKMVVLPSNYDQSAIESQDEFTALEDALDTLSTYDGRLSAVETGLAAVNTRSVNNGDEMTLTSGTWETMASISHGIGNYLVICFAYFNTASGGNRQLHLNESETSDAAMSSIAQEHVAPVDGARTTARLILTINATAAGTWYVHGYQNSGSSLLARAFFQLIKLK